MQWGGTHGTPVGERQQSLRRRTAEGTLTYRTDANEVTIATGGALLSSAELH